MLNVQIGNVETVIARFEAMPRKLHDAILFKMMELQQKLIAKVRDNLSGKILQARSGALRNSIAGRIADTPNSITATVGSFGNVPYARIQELGGTTSPHDIVPNKAQALAYVMDGKLTFSKIVHHPGSKIPAHFYLGQAIEDMRSDIIRGIGEAAVEAAIL